MFSLFTATNFTNLLQLIQPATAQQLQLAGLSPTSLVVSAGSDQTGHQDKLPSQTDLRPECSSSPPPSTQGWSSSLCPSLPAHGHVEVVVGGPAGSEQQQDSRGGGETESLKSLLNEINFLNQQTVTAETLESPPGKQSPEVDSVDPPPRPWVLQLDSDSDDAVTTEIEEAGITGHGAAPTLTNSKSGVLAPPPLLQMNVGSANVVAPSSSNGPAGEGGAGGGSTEGGVALRPMPRLVPLGLRGNQTA